MIIFNNYYQIPWNNVTISLQLSVQSSVDHVNYVNLGQLMQRVLELEQYTNTLLTEKEQFMQEVTWNMYIHNLSISLIKIDNDGQN